MLQAKSLQREAPTKTLSVAMMYDTIGRHFQDGRHHPDEGEEKEEGRETMNEGATPRGDKLVLRRVRCGRCQMPLLRVYERDLRVSFHHQQEMPTPRSLLPSFYRALTDPTPLLTCPRCGAVLSPATTTAVLP